MMRARCTVVDYNSGNTLSVCRAIEHCGGEADLTSDPKRIANAERVILPGVGAFGDAMARLNERNLVEPIRRYAETGRPFLGICVGMQVMMEYGEEFGHHEGLGLIPGRVVAIPLTDKDGNRHRIPHIGWARIEFGAGGLDWGDSIFQGINPGAWAYFVHSFVAEPSDATHRLADSIYGGYRLAAAIRRGSLFGCQFHPEKSSLVGLEILTNFLALPALHAAAGGSAVLAG